MLKRLQKIFAAGIAALPLVTAQGNTENGNIAACKAQACRDCPIYASANQGYPTCLIYGSSGNLDGYEADSGHGYDVCKFYSGPCCLIENLLTLCTGWNSGQPNPGCQIIVRTPASTDLPACGYFLRGWGDAGCYYTLIQQS